MAHDYGKPLVVDTPLVIYKIRYDDGDTVMEHLHLGVGKHLRLGVGALGPGEKRGPGSGSMGNTWARI